MCNYKSLPLAVLIMQCYAHSRTALFIEDDTRLVPGQLYDHGQGWIQRAVSRSSGRTGSQLRLVRRTSSVAQPSQKNVQEPYGHRLCFRMQHTTA